MPDLPDHSAAELFEAVWRELAVVIGTTATAMLVRNAVRAAKSRSGINTGVQITREGFECRYSLPNDWHERGGSPYESLQALLHALRPLLIELTGPVLVRRLARSPLADVARVFGAKETV